MSIASDIKKLGEDIVASYDIRVKAIGELVSDVHKMLRGFQVEHEEMSDELKADLAKGEEDRLKVSRALMAETQKFVFNLAKEVTAMIKGFQKEHKEMATALRESLDKGETERIKAFKSMMTGIQKGIKEIEAYVKNKLKEFSDAHADMGEELKKELAKYVDDMVKATKKLMSDIQARQKERNLEVADLLEAFGTEREKMAANWQALTTKMAKRRGIKPKVEAEVKVRPVEEAIKEVKPKKRLPKLTRKQKDILTVVKENPDGITLPEIAYAMGVPFVTLARDAKKLIDLKQIKKRENRYYPA